MFLNYICNQNYYRMQERFKQLLDEKNLTATRFAALIKVNASAMSHILNGRSKPGFDVLDKIAQAFPDVNLNWLISGKGSIYNVSSIERTDSSTKKNLFKQKEETESVSSVTDDTEANKILSPVSPEIVVAKAKPIKRIILFFEDGSFEDYEK